MKRDATSNHSTDQSTEENRVSSLYVASVARLKSMGDPVVVVFQIADVFDNAAAALFEYYLTAASGSHDRVHRARGLAFWYGAGVVQGSKVRLMDD
jgi:hypothetical protein